jgi:hypothetical protein
VTEWNPSSDAAADVLRLLAEISDRLMLRPAAVAAAPAAPRAPGIRTFLERAFAAA